MKRHKVLIRIGILFALYFVTATFGLQLGAVNNFATLVWPPTGIALAAVLLFGYRVWPGIAVAAFLVNFNTGAPLLVALGIALGNTLEAVTGTYLLRLFAGFGNSFKRVRDVCAFLFLGVLVSTLVSATIGVSSLYLGSVISIAAVSATWMAWWLGDMLGALVVTPLILVWGRRNVAAEQGEGKAAEAVALVIATVVLGVGIFFNIFNLDNENASVVYLIFIPLLWAAVRFGLYGATFLSFAISVNESESQDFLQIIH